MIYPSSKFSEREQKNKTDSEDHTTNRVTVYFYFLLFYALNVFIRKKNKCSNVFLSITLYFSCLLCQRELANKSVKLYKLNLGLFNLVNQYDFRNGNPLQYSCLENPMDGGAWQATVHGVLKSWTLLSDFTFTFHFHVLEKEMATHSSVLAWRISGMVEPGGLPSMGHTESDTTEAT